MGQQALARVDGSSTGWQEGDVAAWPCTAVVGWGADGRLMRPDRISRSAVLTFLAEHSIAAVSFDVHGHGDSEPCEGARGRHSIRSLHHLLDDARAHIEHVVLPLLDQGGGSARAEHFLMGSSMGGLVVRAWGVWCASNAVQAASPLEPL